MQTRIIAVSDSHGMLSDLEKTIQLAMDNGRIDIFVFLGDVLDDLEEVKPILLRHNPGIRLIAVRGNNDFRSTAPALEEFTVNGRTFIATHGHSYHVKLSLSRLSYAARERNADVALYGHTHISRMEEAYGIWLINPGAICNAFFRKTAYAEIWVSEDGVIRPDLIRWPARK